MPKTGLKKLFALAVLGAAAYTVGQIAKRLRKPGEKKQLPAPAPEPVATHPKTNVSQRGLC